jgi:flagellar basal body L-ring protein FlgH
MNKTKLLTTFLIFIFISSCGSIVDRFHKQIDRDMGRMESNYTPKKKQRKFNPYSPKNRSARSSQYSTRTHQRLKPSVRRYYRPVESIRKRYTATDLNDNDNTGSLWSGNNKSSDLFSVDSFKRNGDIILIEVKSSLKAEITQELKRTFPSRSSASSKGKPKTAAPASTAASTDPNAVQDKISSVIIEEVKDKYLLVKGRKTLIFNNRKRMVEIQALVARRDITDNDTLDSNQILESTINIVR